MSKQQEISNETDELADDARALMAATADVGGAKAADEAVHEHPYQAMAIALGVGMIIGYLAARRNRD
jgi:ElaB/YqjD/DUF883 family membrane-anchored ribosome-binding protein